MKKRQLFKHGQSAFEYIMLVAVVMLFVVSGIGLIYSYSQRSNDEIKAAGIEKVGIDIIDTVEKVYYIGGDSWQTIKLTVPNGVSDIYILNNNELIIEYETFGGYSHAVFYSDVNMTSTYSAGNRANISDSFHAGLNMIKVMAQGQNVSIEEVR